MSGIVVFKDGQIVLSVQVKAESVWLTQKQMAELFERSVKMFLEHIGNVYKGKELVREATIRKLRIVQKEGVCEVERMIDHYNLDVMISHISAYLFVLFLHKNGILYRNSGETLIDDNALAALTLLVAGSDPAQKEIIIRLIMNMLVEGEG